MKYIIPVIVMLTTFNLNGQSLSGQPQLAKQVRHERMIIRSTTGSNTLATIIANKSTKDKVRNNSKTVIENDPEMWLCNRKRGVGYSGTRSGGYNTLDYLFKLFLQ